MSASRAGYIALIGRPNVGKSTLLNRLLDQKISITSPKPQTTRHNVLGIKTLPDTQYVYVDTPGLHVRTPRAINRQMNRTAGQALDFVDVVVMLTEAVRWTDEDQDVLRRLEMFQGPVIAAINKTDRLVDKSPLLPYLKALSERRSFAAMVPISARNRDNLHVLEEEIGGLLPQAPFLFPQDQLTTSSERFLCAEIVREKLMRLLREELPYALAVEVESFVEEPKWVRIDVVIWVERPSQKAIVIGAKGATLKEVGRQARGDMERLLDGQVVLKTWVKVREGWSDDERALRDFGYFAD